MNTIHIIVADDHPVLRLGLRSMFEQSSRIRVVGEARSGSELLEKAKRLVPDVVLLDYYFGDEDTTGLTREIRRARPKTKVLFISYSSDPIIVQKSIKAGASGFVIKSEGQATLIEAVLTVAAGRRYFSEPIRQVLNHISKGFDPGIQKLTRREFEILEYVTKEYTNKEIGEKLFISPRTVETHKRNIMQKLRIKNSIGMVNYYFKLLKAQESKV